MKHKSMIYNNFRFPFFLGSTLAKIRFCELLLLLIRDETAAEESCVYTAVWWMDVSDKSTMGSSRLAE